MTTATQTTETETCDDRYEPIDQEPYTCELAPDHLGPHYGTGGAVTNHRGRVHAQAFGVWSASAGMVLETDLDGSVAEGPKRAIPEIVRRTMAEFSEPLQDR